ncbi:MAG: NINE protein [bacterium]|nr:NINE protein [bacterium]
MSMQSRLCPQCGKEAVPETDYCLDCGATLPARPQPIRPADISAYDSEQPLSLKKAPIELSDKQQPSTLEKTQMTETDTAEQPRSLEKPQNDLSDKQQPITLEKAQMTETDSAEQPISLDQPAAENGPLSLAAPKSADECAKGPISASAAPSSAPTSIANDDNNQSTITSLLNQEGADLASSPAESSQTVSQTDSSRIASHPLPAYCPECGAPISAAMVFCDACGFKLSEDIQPEIIACPACGMEMEAKMNFCSRCGSALHEFQPAAAAWAAPHTQSLPLSLTKPRASGSLPQPIAVIEPPCQAAASPSDRQTLPSPQPEAIPYPPLESPASQPKAVMLVKPLPPGQAKDKWTALLLCFFLGSFGAHKFYEGKTGQGLFYLLTFWVLGIFTLMLAPALICLLCLVDFVVLLCKPNPYVP